MAQDIDSEIRDLIKSLPSYNDLKRVEARKALVAIGGPAVPSLIEALKDPNKLMRWEAAKALGEIGDPRSAPMLVEALEDEQFEVRWLAANALIEMNVNGLKPLFRALMEHADSVVLREGAHRVLHALAKGDLGEYVAPVLVDLEDFDSVARIPATASQALEKLERFQKKAAPEGSLFLRQFTARMPGRSALDSAPHGVIAPHHHTPKRASKWS